MGVGLRGEKRVDVLVDAIMRWNAMTCNAYWLATDDRGGDE